MRSGDNLQEEYVYSICAKNTTEIYAQYKIAESLPGEICDSYGSYYRCAYGRKKCYFGRCIGFSKGEHCFSTNDCDPGLFCNANICSAFLDPGTACSDSIQCGRSQRCKFSDENGMGVCAALYSVPSDTSTLITSILCQDRIRLIPLLIKDCRHRGFG